ncbi:MAG: hypothetical protein RL728_1158, partial [Bacteroidota bacterium]
MDHQKQPYTIGGWFFYIVFVATCLIIITLEIFESKQGSFWVEIHSLFVLAGLNINLYSLTDQKFFWTIFITVGFLLKPNLVMEPQKEKNDIPIKEFK